MLIGNNLQLQNQCFRPTPRRSTANTVFSGRQQVENIIELRRSQSSEIDSTNIFTKNKSNFQVSKQMANHFLCNVKDKFKQIFKSKAKNQRKNKVSLTERKISTSNMQDNRNLSVVCESRLFIEKRKNSQKPQDKQIHSKKLINLKKCRLFRGHRDAKQQTYEQKLKIEDQLYQQAINIEIEDQEDLEERYLKSQFDAMKKLRIQQRIKTQKRTIEQKRLTQITKYESQMIIKSNRHSSAKQYCLQFDPPLIKLSKKKSNYSGRLTHRRYESQNNYKRSPIQRKEGKIQDNYKFDNYNNISLQPNFQF